MDNAIKLRRRTQRVQANRFERGHFAMTNNTENYGWNESAAPCSCSFVAPKVIQILKDVGAQSVVDVGCGNGALCGLLHSQGLRVVGVEYDKTGCELARQTYPKITFHHLGVYDSPDAVTTKEGGRFDCVVSTEVIEHLYSPQCLPSFADQLLVPKGYLVISTPYHGYLKNLMLSLFNHWDTHHTTLWEGGHIKFWSKKTLCHLLEQKGFRVVKFYGVGRVPFMWKSMIILAQKV
jgi:2-polyprenyl-3-methyl-5-hydroxy-6-metoxy-1,4-benzoquinol methylase